ncbi:hypothetical protein J2768_000547 [Agrobacterium tumefaciens]|uniref:hypothetical protein n=1 Tax=Agrobacterium tumefaciens TaxID=358 RepID=UPI001AEB548A|nr:hypothetical protein [Agrobacterium tumefaciens]MBP2538149.1 hypothetical protein [Agrobacterium tumefaciens]
MSQLEYIFDNHELAKKFVNSLPPKTQRERFRNFREWTPERVALIKIDGRLVAMADAIVTVDNKAANVSLVSRPGFGAYAIYAMLALKKRLDGRNLFSTVTKPTPPTIAISRRFFHEVFDQGAWEMSSHLIKTFGPDNIFFPTPIAVTDKFMASVGLPSVEKLDERSRNQIISVAKDPSKAKLKTPDDFVLDGPHLMALAFDVLNLPMKHRQSITRLNIATMAAAKGVSVAPELLQKIADPKSLSIFTNLLNAQRTGEPEDGCFVVEAQNISFESAFRSLRGLPGLPGLPATRSKG